MSEKDKLLEIVKKRIDASGIFVDLLDELLEPALKKVVADTSNPLDDVLMQSIYPVLKQVIKDLADEKLKELLGE